MAKSTSLMLPQNVNNDGVTLTSADTTVAKTCFTAGSNDSIIKSVIVTSDDTAVINLKFYIRRSNVDYLLATVNIPVSAGTTGGVLGIDAIAAAVFPGLTVDSMGKPSIPLKTGEILKVGCLVTMTAAKTCTVNILGEDF